MKENIRHVDAKEVLQKVVQMPMTTWNMKTQDSSIRHLGPMAQDFYAAFGLGESERYITSSDADGVALAAIQGLNDKLEEKNDALYEQLQKEIQGLKTEITSLRHENEELRSKIESRPVGF